MSPDAADPPQDGARGRAELVQLAQDARTDLSPASERYLTPLNLLIVISSVAIAAFGQLMLRHGMRVARGAAADGGSLVWHAVTSPSVIGGLAVFAVSAVLWLAALSRVPLSVAYPFNALGYIGILTASALVLHEHVTVRTWMGCAFVVAGLLLVVSGTAAP